MRLMDIMLAIPGLLFAIGIVAMLGPGLVPGHDRDRRRQHPDLRAAAARVDAGPARERLRAGGARRRRAAAAILTPHVLPNSISPVIVQGTLAMATAIIDVAGLGFLGLGPQDPGTPEWGTMLTERDRYLQSAPLLAFIPGVAIVFSVLGLQPDRRRAPGGPRPEAARPC